MTILGWVSEKDRQQSLCYTPYLPSTHFYEKHHSAPIYATPQAILNAVEQYDMRNDRVADALMTVRELPGRCCAWAGKSTHSRNLVCTHLRCCNVRIS
ncbi:hypothetical protein ERHA55_52860 (plasmid) [Erwinia rhapontici]|nr:hypothetical protein [Erwinia rhapontici]BCQ47759.1 hypothetical protein ERHA55_52860 [Erwinia rhapontici]